MAREFKLPDLGEGLAEAEIIRVLVSEGDLVKEDQIVLEVETDKAQVELPSPFAGRVAGVHVREGERIPVGAVLLSFDGETGAEGQGPSARDPERSRPSVAPAPPAETREAARPHEPAPGPVPAAPATRRLARELGVDLRLVRGSGPGGRVTPEDVQAFAASQPRAEPREAPPAVERVPPRRVVIPRAVEIPPLPRFEQWGPVERQPLRSIRQRVAERMALAWAVVPHVTHFDQADITDLESLRRQHQALARETGAAELTLTAFVIKATVAALKAYPQFNASLDHEAGELVLKHYYHVGVAVDTGRGLIVPVLRDADRKGLVELATELADLARRTREGKIEVAELRGGTFTITNIGPIGGTGAMPIVNYPEVAILGLARARETPVVREGQVAIRLILPLSLSFDHRVADGADAARFVAHLVRSLEEPGRLLLG